MVVFLVLINQAQVGITVRLSFFNRDWFNAIQNEGRSHVLATAAVRLHALGLRLRREHRHRIRRAVDAGDPLAALAHRLLRLPLARRPHPLPHEPDRQRRPTTRTSASPRTSTASSTAAKVRGAGIYSYSILLISTLSSLVSFAVVLWGLSDNFTIPGTDMHVPGFLFWIALIYAAAGTWITHVIGRSLIGLYFERQHMEADFRFSLARLREYSEQVALLDGERDRAGVAPPPLRRDHRQLSRPRQPPQEADRLHRRPMGRSLRSSPTSSPRRSISPAPSRSAS